MLGIKKMTYNKIKCHLTPRRPAPPRPAPPRPAPPRPAPPRTHTT